MIRNKKVLNALRLIKPKSRARMKRAIRQQINYQARISIAAIKYYEAETRGI